MSPQKFAKWTTVRNLAGLLAVYVTCAICTGLVANALMGGCSGSPSDPVCDTIPAAP